MLVPFSSCVSVYFCFSSALLEKALVRAREIVRMVVCGREGVSSGMREGRDVFGRLL